MSHILVIESWVEGTGRILPKRICDLGHEYTFVTRNPSHYADKVDNIQHPIFQYAKHFITAETNDLSKLIPLLRELHKVLHFDGVITICDYYIETVAHVAGALDLPQAASDVVATERKKHLVRNILKENALGCPAYQVAHNIDECLEAAAKIGYPLVVKPSDLSSSAFVKLVNNPDELSTACSAILENRVNFREQVREPIVLLEELIEGEEFSVESVTFKGETTFLGITDKSIEGEPYFIENGHMFPANIDEEKENTIINYVSSVLKALGHNNGIAHSEVKLTRSGPILIEVNPRPAGNYIVELIKLVTGIDLLDVLINLSIGEKPELIKQDTGVTSSAIVFYVPKQIGSLISISGIENISKNENFVRAKFVNANNRDVSESIDNACYLGHIIAQDKNGKNARAIAEELLKQIEVKIC